MKKPDPDDLKIPHKTIADLLAAFRQTWQQHRNENENENEIELSHTNQG